MVYTHTQSFGKCQVQAPKTVNEECINPHYISLMRKPCPRCARVCLLRHVSPWFCYLVRMIPASLLFLQSFRALTMASKLAWNSLPPLCQLLLLSHGFSCSLILSFLCIGLCPLHLCIERTKNFFILYSPPLTHLDCSFTYPVTLAKTLFSGFSSADLSSWKGCFHIASSSSLCSHLPRGHAPSSAQ